MNVIAVLNAHAGTAAKDDAVTEASLREAFTAGGFQVELNLLPPGQIEGALKRAIAKKPAALFVGGGDGTVSAAASLLADTGIPLAVLPLGTLNHFAKDLGLPSEWRKTIAVLAHGEIRAVDVGEVNGYLFVNNCSLGVYADAVRHRETLRDEHDRGKWSAMFVASFRVFRRLRRTRFHLETDDGDFQLRSPFLFVANNRYDGNILHQSLRERLDEGRLWIYTTRARHHFAVLRMAWQALRHELSAADELDSHACTGATVHLPAPVISAAIDGEIVALKTPLHFRIRPGALTVLVPSPKLTRDNP